MTLPSLLTALSHDGSTAVLRVQRGADQGALYFSEGALIHAQAGMTAGDEAVYRLLEWHDGRFRLVRDDNRQPHTITHPLTDFLERKTRPEAVRNLAAVPPTPDQASDERLLQDLLGLLTRLEHDRARLVEARASDGGVSVLHVITTVINSVVAFALERSSDPHILPSHVLARLAETEPYTQLLGEEQERIDIATAAAVLRSLKGSTDERQRTFQDLCRVLCDVLALYGNTIVSRLFHHPRQREEWQATFDLFVEDLGAAVQQITV